MAHDPRDDEPGDEHPKDGSPGGIPDDLSDLTSGELSELGPEDIPDDLSGLDLPSPRDEPSGPSRPGPRGADEGPAPDAVPGGWDLSAGRAGDDEVPGDGVPGDEVPGDGVPGTGPLPEGQPVDQRSAWTRLVERYIEIRVATMVRDGGPGIVLRWSARAPLVTTLLLAILVGVVLVATFGIPPVSPLFLIPVVCGPVYPWLRLESQAQAAWRAEQGP